MTKVVHAFTTEIPVWSPYVTPVDLAQGVIPGVSVSLINDATGIAREQRQQLVLDGCEMNCLT